MNRPVARKQEWKMPIQIQMLTDIRVVAVPNPGGTISRVIEEAIALAKRHEVMVEVRHGNVTILVGEHDAAADVYVGWLAAVSGIAGTATAEAGRACEADILSLIEIGLECRRKAIQPPSPPAPAFTYPEDGDCNAGPVARDPEVEEPPAPSACRHCGVLPYQDHLVDCPMALVF